MRTVNLIDSNMQWASAEDAYLDAAGVSLLKNIWDRYYDQAQKLNLIRGDAVE